MIRIIKKGMAVQTPLPWPFDEGEIVGEVEAWTPSKTNTTKLIMVNFPSSPSTGSIIFWPSQLEHISHDGPLAPRTFDGLAQEVHQTAREHGWWASPRTFGELIALCHSELSEALEEHRNGKEPRQVYFNPGSEKPEGIPIELADTVIRILDMCGYYNIDLGTAIRAKMDFNKKRPYLHGGKKL